MCEEADLREMGIPMGPRKKLLGFLRELKEKQVRCEHTEHGLHMKMWYDVFYLKLINGFN